MCIRDRGTLYAESKIDILQAGTFIAALHDGTANEQIRIIQNTNTISCQVIHGGAAEANLLTQNGAVAGTIYKSALAYQSNDAAGVTNNGTVQTDGTVVLPSASTTLAIGMDAAANQQTGVYIRKVAYYPVRMVNESAKALTV